MLAREMDSSDWEPLEPSQLGVHPGEEAELNKAAPKPAPRRPQAPSEADTRLRADEEAEQAKALHELKKRIAASADKRSLVDEISEREARQSRPRGPVKQAIRDIAVRSSRTAADVPLAVEYDEGAEARDPREDQAWFKALPAKERERLHDSWAQKRGQAQASTAMQRRTRGRRIGSALIIFAATAVLGTPGMWPVTIAAGVLCAVVWSYISPCRYRDAITALGCFYTVSLSAWLLNSSGSLAALTFMDAILLVAFAAVAGFNAEIRRAGGFDACR